MGCAMSRESAVCAHQLLKAVQDGEVGPVRAALCAAPSLLSAYTRPSGYLLGSADTPLHIACEMGRLEAVEALCEFVEGARIEDVREALRPHCQRNGVPEPASAADGLRLAVNLPNNKGQTPLMYAAHAGHANIVAYVLQHGADPWTGDRCGSRTALHYAAMSGSVACIAALLDTLPQHQLVRNGNRYCNVRTVCGLAPLHYAVCGNHDAAVVELLRHEPCITSGSSFTAYDLCVMPDNGSTPLHFAAFKGRLNPALAILRFYAQRQHSGTVADPRLRTDSAGRRPWQVAASRGYPEMSEALDPQRDLLVVLAGNGNVGQALMEMAGPRRLCAIAGDALRQKLLQGIEQAVMAAAAAQPSPAAASGQPAGCGAADAGTAVGCSGPAVEAEDDYDSLCGVCFARQQQVAPRKCGHGLCGECALQLCRPMGCKPLPCPFCREPVAGFVRKAF